MAKRLSSVLAKSDIPGGAQYWHWCPGCKIPHGIHVGVKNHSNAWWTFDGNIEYPTFNPSIRCIGSGDKTICHYFINNGIQRFCDDSPHEFKGQNVPLQPLPGWVCDGPEGAE